MAIFILICFLISLWEFWSHFDHILIIVTFSPLLPDPVLLSYSHKCMSCFYAYSVSFAPDILLNVWPTADESDRAKPLKKLTLSPSIYFLSIAPQLGEVLTSTLTLCARISFCLKQGSNLSKEISVQQLNFSWRKSRNVQQDGLAGKSLQDWQLQFGFWAAIW